MTSQEQLAREWAQLELDNAGEFSGKGRIAAAEFILANTRKPTMDEVEWSHKEHSLQGATDISGDELVMLDMQRPDEESDPELFVWDGVDVTRDNPDYYTPNGKRYEIREITGPEHPEILEAIEQYLDAPDGTVVAANQGNPFMKNCDTWYMPGLYRSSQEMVDSGSTHRVLRWGWGERSGE